MMNNTRSQQPNIVSEEQQLIETIAIKLKENSTFTGYERQFLITKLQKYSDLSAVKRKFAEIEENENASSRTKANKRVQVCFSATNSKDSFSQTEDLSSIQDEVHNSEENEQRIFKIKKLAATEKRNAKEIDELMSETFDDRRNFILIKSPPVLAVKDKYPLLFDGAEIRNELDRIFYEGKCLEFLENVEKYSEIILEESGKSDPIYQRTMKSIEHCHIEQQQKYARMVGSILLIPKIFKEELDFVNLLDNQHTNEVYPYIDASVHKLKDMFFDNALFKIMVEGQLLCQANDFKEAILCLVSSFFIFNIDYPAENFRTFVVFEKLYLNIDETKNLDEYTDKMIKLLKIQLIQKS